MEQKLGVKTAINARDDQVDVAANSELLNVTEGISKFGFNAEMSVQQAQDLTMSSIHNKTGAQNFLSEASRQSHEPRSKSKSIASSTQVDALNNTKLKLKFDSKTKYNHTLH